MSRLILTFIIAAGAAAPALAAHPTLNSPPARAVTRQTTCLGDRAALGAHSGEYLRTDILQTALATRMWFNNVERPHDAPDAISIEPEGDVSLSLGWHEAEGLVDLVAGERESPPGPGASARCLTFHPGGVIAHFNKVPVAYTYIGPDPYAASEYFNLLFKGCFKDELSEKWCFADGTVRIGRRVRQATFAMDDSEMPTPGSVLKLDGEPLLWVFRPRGTGWAVFQSVPASDSDYVEPNWARPWRVLTPAAQ